MSIKNKLHVFIIISVFFICGVAVGHYKILPFDLLQPVKSKEILSIKEPFSSSERFKTHEILFSQLIDDYDVVFLGDSITNSGRWSELFPNHTVANRGIPGDTSEGISKRLDNIIRLNPKTVFLMFGINDISRGEEVDSIFENYQKIVSTLEKNKINVVIQSTLLSDRDNWNIKVNALNEKLLSLATKSNIPYVDINKSISPTGELTKEVSHDGIHLRPASYLKWRDAIKKTQGLEDF